ncbi:hypothetical protein WJ972_20260 [Achromobacter insuavis]
MKFVRENSPEFERRRWSLSSVMAGLAIQTGNYNSRDENPIFRRWWDRQNERNAIKNDLIAFSKHCLLAVGRHVPDARRPRVRGVWYGDPTHSRIVWTDGAGRQWRWPLFILFSVCQKTPDERDLIPRNRGAPSESMREPASEVTQRQLCAVLSCR